MSDFVSFAVDGDELVCPTCAARFANSFDGLMNGARPHAQQGCTTSTPNGASS